MVRQYTQQVKEQLRTFKELTSAFLGRRNKQVGRRNDSFSRIPMSCVLKVPSVVSPQGPSALAPASFPPLHLPPVSHHSGPAAADVLEPERNSPELPKRLSPSLSSGDAGCDEWHLPNISERFCTVATTPSPSQRDNQSKAERRRLQLPLLPSAREGQCCFFVEIFCHFYFLNLLSVGWCWSLCRPQK